MTCLFRRRILATTISRATTFLATSLIAVLFVGCSVSPNGKAPVEFKPTVILISFDGLGADYMQTFNPPNLTQLAEEGVYARDGMISVFPTKTFPNHYSIVTGLYPEHHGIVANNMFDPDTGKSFSIGNREAVEDPSWWGGEPIWVTAEKQGQTAATYFWVGSEAPIKGVQPTYWYRYDRNIPGEERFDQALAWLDLPEDERPTFISLYISEVDTKGHRFGPDAPETRDAVLHADSLLGRLMDGLKARDLQDKVNVITVADHGMSAVSRDRVVLLDDYIDLNDVRIIDRTPVAAMIPAEGRKEAVLRALQNADPHLHAYAKDNIPERLHYRDNNRIPEIIAWVDDGWTIVPERRRFEDNPGAVRGATHGYDNKALSMRALFIAEGPAFKSGVIAEPFENIQIYDMIAHILGLTPAPNDGDPQAMSQYLNE